MLLRRKLERAVEKIEMVPRPLPISRTADEWAALSCNAARIAAWRERSCLKELLKGHSWCAADVAHALTELGYLEELFDTKPIMSEHVRRGRELMEKLERKHLGDDFGLFFVPEYKMYLTLDKTLRTTQAAASKGLSS
eukprot:1052270-Pleurochrysis_carterae.AAC.1